MADALVVLGIIGLVVSSSLLGIGLYRFMMSNVVALKAEITNLDKCEATCMATFVTFVIVAGAVSLVAVLVYPR